MNTQDPYNSYNGYVDPYNDYNGGMIVDNFNDYEVEDFTADSLFGRNKIKKAEKKLKKAEKKLAHGNVKAANRKISKANKIISGTAAAQQNQLANMQQLQDVKATQQQINNTGVDPQPLPPSTMPMSNTGSSMSDMGYTAGMSTGVESTSPNNGGDLINPEPDPTLLPNVTVTSHKSNIALLILVAVLLVFAIVYMSKKKKK